MRRRQRLGQHFLISQTVAKKIIDSAGITRNDTVLEIGTGQGILVPLLCKKAGRVISIESDSTLYREAAQKFSKLSNLVLKHGDGFESSERFSIFVSNLPYSESRTAMEWLIQQKYSRAVVMVQREFYEKLVAQGKERRAISVLVSYSADIEKIMNVNRNNFAIPPKVDSVVLKITRKKTISKELIQAVNKLFSYKKKTIQNILKQFGKKVESDKRLHDLTGDEVIQIAKKIL